MKQAKKRIRFSTILLILVLVAGLCLVLYPTLSSQWNARRQSRAVANYTAAVASLTDHDYAEIFDAAHAYNERLASVGSAAMLSNPDQLEGYWDTLDLTGTGIMGYVTIEKLNVELPIYHGTSVSVLSAGAGHLQGTSLPVGGETTHSVISAHRGLPSATLFTHLDKLEVGDTFTITVLDEVLTYEVDQITIVLPDEMEDIYVRNGADYCTLMTCTPYGINTHRLLVRGVRMETPETEHIRVTADAYRIQSILVAPFLAMPLLVILVICLLIGTRRRKDKRRNSHEKK